MNVSHKHLFQHSRLPELSPETKTTIHKNDKISKIESSIKSKRAQITELDVSGFNNSFDRFVIKAKRFINFFKLIGGLLI